MNLSPRDINGACLTKIYFPHAKYKKVRSLHLGEKQEGAKVLKISPKTIVRPNSDQENSNSCYRIFAKNMHLLGIRPMFEFFKEVRDGAPFESTLERYSGLVKYAKFIEVNGGKDLPPNARLIISKNQK
jgi:hypothetical protein